MRYATSADGTSIAHTITGSGSHDVLEVGGYGTLFSVDSCSDLVHIQQFEDQLGRFARLIRFDQRGLGSSDGQPESVVLDALVEDCVAVLDAAQSTSTAVLATGYGGPIGMALAARFPDRVDHLVLANTWPAAPDPTVAERVETIDATKDAPSDLIAMAPSLAADPVVQRWWERESRRGSRPSIVKAYWRFVRDTNVRDMLADITCPVTVLDGSRNTFADPAANAALAATLGASLHSFDTADFVLWAMPQSEVLAILEEALTGSVSHAGVGGDLVAVAFTDIVGSTTRNSADGDLAWASTVRRHDELAQRVSASKGGTYVKSTGDGALLLFGSATAAIDGLRALQIECQDLGIQMRAAVHIAEIQRVGRDVVGVGVALTARLLDHADAGEIVVSSTVREALVGGRETFDAVSDTELRGVPGTWSLFRVTG